MFGDIVRCLNEAGHPIRGAEDDEVDEALSKALSDDKNSEAVGSLIAYDSNDGIVEIGLESLDNAYTTRILSRLGFTWPETGSAYIRRFIDRMDSKGFFGGKDQ